MSPRRFRSRTGAARSKGTRLDGATITWRLNKAATVKLKFQRSAGTQHGAGSRSGTITRSAKAGKGDVRFRGRFGQRLARPGPLPLGVVARQGGERRGRKRVRFKVVKP